jgi:hypothetical protein
MNRTLLILAALTALAQVAAAETVKCRVGERTVYQEGPCPAGAAVLPMGESIPDPDAFAVDDARRRAVADKVQLHGLEQERAAREQAEREAAEAAAKHQRKQAKQQAKKCKALKTTTKKTDSAKVKLQEQCP